MNTGTLAAGEKLVVNGRGDVVGKAAPTDWKALCEQTAKRLQIAEASLEDTRKTADDMRGRMQKYKTRLDSAQSEVSRLQAQVVELTARLERQEADHASATRERDERLARQDVIKRKVYEYRQSLLEGPIWDIFAEL